MRAMTTLDTVLEGLLARHRAAVPDVEAITGALLAEGAIRSEAELENDHLAFRTLGEPRLGIAALERIFLALGYERRDRLEFPAKKLTAFWYSPPAPRYPRVFVSELKLGEISGEAAALVRSYTDEVAADPLAGLDLANGEAIAAWLYRPLWRRPTWADYERLRAESEYAAWAVYHGHELNHFTVAVQGLPAGLDTVEGFNRFLLRRGFELNDAGGLVKVSRDGKLLQSSTVAALIHARFDDGKGGFELRRIPGAYVEFAERRVLDAYANLPRVELRREHRREGFEAENADRIFESTYTAQTQKQPGSAPGR